MSFNENSQNMAGNNGRDYDEIVEKEQNVNNIDLSLKFQNIIGQKTCLPELPQQGTHFSDLPTELVLYIMKMVARDDTKKFKMLDQCAAVCRGWYLCARNHVIYRQTCYKIWAENSMSVEKFGGSWRRMLLERNHVYKSGCYVYFDRIYGFFHYIRFFSDEEFQYTVLQENPREIVPMFKNIKESPIKNSVNTGEYKFIGDELYLIFKETKCVLCERDSCINTGCNEIAVYEVKEYRCLRYGLLCYVHHQESKKYSKSNVQYFVSRYFFTKFT